MTVDQLLTTYNTGSLAEAEARFNADVEAYEQELEVI